ncbi:MAG: helix-turn-helix transcriptional regulator [Steroidobacteraceae bacterium]
MNSGERWVVAAVLAVVAVLIGTDLLQDSGEGVARWHVLAEGIAGLLAALGFFYLLRDTFSLRRRLVAELATSTALRAEAERWRNDARRHVEGLSIAIDRQLGRWQLTAAEKEIAFLLLKGFGFKEIATLRNTSEKTARTQSTSVYAKAGLSGRTELAAFFLEDLMAPLSSRENPPT